MATSGLYGDDKERRVHSNAIQMLAKDFNIPEKEIEVLYETTLSGLMERARIKDFLSILVSRNVKDMLKRGLEPHMTPHITIEEQRMEDSVVAVSFENCNSEEAQEEPC